ncbi:MAG TPA: NAD(P)/FAD-dependent oxidoreductase [Syntrophaceae bacterium]|nr:NAD(P)/FAD-dependent oxidoreductase [Syntrophaceae bacterium]
MEREIPSSSDMLYDLIIVGAGPAGLSASLTACYLRLKHIVLEATAAGGALMQRYPAKKVDSFLGFKGLTGKEVARRIIEHVKSEGGIIIEGEEVKEIRRDGENKIFQIVTGKNRYRTKTVLITIGIIGCPRKLCIPGEDTCECVDYCLVNPEDYRGKEVLVIGGGDSALEAAVMLDEVCKKIYIAHRKDKFRATEKNQERLEQSGVQVLWNTELKQIFGTKKIEKVCLFNNKTDKENFLEVDNVLIFCGSILNVDFLRHLGLEIEKNRLKAKDDMSTELDGLYAAGDITGRLRRIPEAIGQGHRAVYSIYKYLKKPYWA